MSKYDYDRTDGVLKYKDKNLVGSFLLSRHKKQFIKGPFLAEYQGASYGGFYIAIYVQAQRVGFEDIVYSEDPDVISAVKEFSEDLEQVAIKWHDDLLRAVAQAKEDAQNSRRSLFAAAVKKWRR